MCLMKEVFHIVRMANLLKEDHERPAVIASGLFCNWWNTHAVLYMYVTPYLNRCIHIYYKYSFVNNISLLYYYLTA